MQDLYFRDKVVAVTGGSDGIGLALVEALLAKGAKVATCARNADKLQTLQQRHSDAPLLCMTADLSQPEGCRHFIEAAIRQFGSIDILINNAGISMRALFKEADPEVIKKLMDINFFGAVYCSKYALPALIDRKGTIVGISSIAGYRGLPGRSGYSASKFALNGWLEAVRTELSADGVHVMWVSPGFTRSNIRHTALDGQAGAQGESPLDEEKLMSAEECADRILEAIRKKKRTLVMTGQGKQTVLLNKLFPAWTDRLIRNFFFRDGKLIK
jgi:short-subunit dehydrogenase